MHKTYFLQALFVLLVCSNPQAWAQESNSAGKEQELLQVLQSGADFSEKAVACKGLAVYGSAGALDELAKLLSEPKLSSWARIAIEAIPGEESDKVLRDAAGKLNDRLLVGVINSIGVRRDSKAVDLLSQKLAGSDVAAAQAAAVALGRIGNSAATDSLRAALSKSSGDLVSSVAEGCVLCAEQRMREGDFAAATEIYDQVRTAKVPEQRIIEATRGAILARKDKGIDLLLETFRSDNKKHFQLALGTIREFPGGELDQSLVSELAKAESSKAALLIQAMADRSETVKLAAIINAAKQGDPAVRLSAIDALKRVGDVSCLTVLLDAANETEKGISDAAKKTLAQLPDPQVNDQIRKLLAGAEGTSHALLLDLVGLRRIDAVKLVTAALEDSDANVRKSALYALGETVDLDQLSVLISQVTGSSASTDGALQALRVACIRMPDPDKCTEKLVAAMENAPSSKGVILEIVSEVGGGAALQTLAKAAKSSDAEQQDIASRLLGKWNNKNAAPVLLDLAQNAPAEKYRIRALRGFIGIARKFPMPEKERVGLCKSAWDVSKRLDEKKLILDVLKIHPSRPGLDLVNQAKQIPELKQQAAAAANAIERKVKR